MERKDQGNSSVILPVENAKRFSFLQNVPSSLRNLSGLNSRASFHCMLLLIAQKWSKTHVPFGIS